MESSAMAPNRKTTSAEGATVSPFPLTTLSSFAAPTTLALTGMLYLTGWEERHKLLRDFGLTNSAFEESIQTTLARGYRPLLMGMFVVLVLFFVLWLVRRMMTAIFSPAPITSRIGAWYLWFWTCFGVLTCSYLAGNISGTLRAGELAEKVERGCDASCYVFFLGRAHYAGFVLTQDSRRTAILTRTGVVLVETAAITSVRARRPVSAKAADDRRYWPFVTLFRE